MFIWGIPFSPILWDVSLVVFGVRNCKRNIHGLNTVWVNYRFVQSTHSENKRNHSDAVNICSFLQTLDGLWDSYGNSSAVKWQLINCRLESISTSWTEIWQSEVNTISAISSLEHCPRLIAFTATFSSFCSEFCHQHLLAAYDLLTTPSLAICCPTASSNTLCISVHHQYQSDVFTVTITCTAITEPELWHCLCWNWYS